MQNASVQIRVTETLRNKLEERANQYGVSVSDYLRHLIIEDLKKAEQEKSNL